MVYKEFPGAGSVVFLEPSAKGAQRVGDAPRSTATGIQGDAKTNALDDLGVFLVDSWVDTNLAHFLVPSSRKFPEFTNSKCSTFQCFFDPSFAYRSRFFLWTKMVCWRMMSCQVMMLASLVYPNPPGNQHISPEREKEESSTQKCRLGKGVL